MTNSRPSRPRPSKPSYGSSTPSSNDADKRMGQPDFYSDELNRYSEKYMSRSYDSLDGDSKIFVKRAIANDKINAPKRYANIVGHKVSYDVYSNIPKQKKAERMLLKN